MAVKRGKPGNLSKLAPYYENGASFELTKEALEELTGGILSERISYLKNRSALAKDAKEHGYSLTVEKEITIPMRIIFKKEGIK